MVYGFDCGHAGDADNALLHNVDWVLGEAKRMKIGIEVAAKYEVRYLLARLLAYVWPHAGNRLIGKVLDSYHAELKKMNIGFDIGDNFGTMINLLTGRL